MSAPNLDRVWTAAEAAALPDGEFRYEVIGGRLCPLPGTGWPYVSVVIELLPALRPHVDAIGGKFGIGTVDVWLPTGDLVRMDVCVLLPTGAAFWSDRGIEGAPDIAIEVLDEHTRRYDRVTKRRANARAGVREYWIVDPSVGSVEVLSLDGDAYTRSRFFADDDVVTSDLLSGWSLPVPTVFEDVDLDPPADDPA